MNKTIQYYKNKMQNHKLIAELETEKFKSYICQNGDNIEFHFRIVFLPNTIFLTGDLGEITLKPQRENTLKWLLNSYDNIPYLMEKVPYNSQNHDKVFDSEQARDFLFELKEATHEEFINKFLSKSEYLPKYKKITEQLDKIIENCINYSSEYEFIQDVACVYPNWHDHRPTFMKYNERALSRIAQIEKFCELYEAQKAK